MSTDTAAGRPWYREPWPWILMSGPLAVIVAGAFTTWIAFATADGLVAEDYYKQGLGVNRLLAREANAARQGIVAQVALPGDRHRISDYPNLYGFLRDIYQTPGIAATVDMAHIRNHYYRSHATINPYGIISTGPAQDLDTAHGRDIRFA